MTTDILTPAFIITNVETTSTGYYFVEFVSADGTRMASATQEGRGGSNLYQYGLKADGEWGWDTAEAFNAWLAENADYAIENMKELDFADLAAVVERREMDWQDIVVMAILDAVDMRKVRVHKNRRAS